MRFQYAAVLVLLACGQTSRPAQVTLTAPSASAVVAVPIRARGAPPVVDGHIAWVSYERAGLEEAKRQRRIVFLNFSASWCAACFTNEREFLETNLVRSALTHANVVPMRADLTNEDADGNDVLASLGRSGIPAYVIIMPDGARDLLPLTITGALVAGHLAEAGRKFPP